MKKHKENVERLDLEWVLSTQQGRRFCYRILSGCGVYNDIIGEGPEVFKQIGRRQIGLNLLGIIANCDELLLEKMMREARMDAATERGKNDDRDRDRNGGDREHGTGNGVLDSILGDYDGGSELSGYENGNPVF